MNRYGKRSILVALVLAGVCGCTARRTPWVLLPGAPASSVTDLLARSPLDAGQPVRAERLGATPHVSYHLVQIQPGAGERPHLHAQHDLSVTLLSGAGTQWTAGHPTPLRAGDSAIIPAGTPHHFVNTGDRPAAALVIFSPPYDGSDQVFLDDR